MSVVNVFCINDTSMTVYQCVSNEVKIVDVFEADDPSSRPRFLEQVGIFENNCNLILFDVSSEDYHQEQLPHVIGRDRKLLISRKYGKYFPKGEYTYSEFVKRLKVGRRDDIYAISGIADSSFIDPIVDLIADNNIVISGVYTLPLLVKRLIRPVIHEKQVLVVSCDVEKNGRYIFRQSFIDGGKLYFSRQTSILTDDTGKVADQFRKEIERTWQYLNNKRVLGSNERMQVMFVSPKELSLVLKAEAGASHCDYQFVDSVELGLQHGCMAASQVSGFSALAAYVLAKKPGKNPHYQPKKLSYFYKHQQINRFLLAACIAAIVVSLGVITFNIKMMNDVVRAGDELAYQSVDISRKLKLHRDAYDYSGISPQKIHAMVNIYNQVSYPETLPQYVFSIISGGFSRFNDLTLSEVEWHIRSSDKSSASFKNKGMAGRMNNTRTDAMDVHGVDGMVSIRNGGLSISENIVVSIKGEVDYFDGDYRRAIKRIERLNMQLALSEGVHTAVVTKLPLEIDPNVKASRSLAIDVIPDFEIEVTLNAGVL